MTLERLREHCLSKKGTSEDTPFGETTLVFRVGQKMFALTGLDPPELSINLKCAPERAIELREQYPAIKPGWHMNKKHWNTVNTEELFDDELLKELIDHSYDLVFQSLKKSDREKILSK